MATLKDVAELAGVSVSTVSYVLNGKKTVRPETLKRIEDAIEQLDYYPNLIASGLKTNQSMTVGIVISDLTNLFVIDVLATIEDELSKRGYCALICNSDNDAKKEKKCFRKLMSRNIDGLLIIGTGGNNFSNFSDVSLPIVCIDRVSGDECFTVRTDNVRSGEMATEHLIAKGYKKILFLGCQDYMFSQERFSGYERAMKKAGLADNIRCHQIVQLRVDAARAEVEKMLQEDSQLPFDAIYACVDYFALGALNALLAHHIQVPDQVGIVGNDDIALAKFSVPALTSVAQPKVELGQEAVKYLFAKMEKKPVREKQHLLMPRLVVRQST